jgi:cell division GTPase FtsZ
MFQEKVVSPIMFLPDEKESPRSKMNALEAFSELSSIEETGATFILDNQRILELNQSFSLKEKFQYTRNDLLNLLHFFNQKTEEESDITNLDKMDLLTTLSERGCSMITEVVIDTEDIKHPDKMGERLINALQFSPFAKTELSNISRAAMIVDLPTELTAFLRAESTFEKIGFPLEIFTGIYEKEEKPKLYTLITGLSYPLNALKELEESVKKEEKRIVESLEHARKQSFSVNTSWTSSLKRERKVKI